MPARLKVQFDEKIRDKLVEQFGYKNKHSVPAIDKLRFIHDTIDQGGRGDGRGWGAARAAPPPR